MVFTLKVTGPPEIEAAFEDFAGTMIRYGLREPVDILFKAGEMQARNEVPVKTGYLRSTIKSERTCNGCQIVSRSALCFVCG